MDTRSAATSALVAALLVCGCSSHRVLVPPRLDLRPYGRLGLITFSAENARGSLPQYATDQFSEQILSAQPGIEVLELGPMDTLLARLGEKEPGIATAQELGKQSQVGAVFAGRLKVSNPNPSGGLAGLLTPHLEATVRVDLTVRLLSTNGATVWRSSAWATEKVGQVALVDGQIEFSARDPKEAYGRLVNRLIDLVTEDFWATWRNQ